MHTVLLSTILTYFDLSLWLFWVFFFYVPFFILGWNIKNWRFNPLLKWQITNHQPAWRCYAAKSWYCWYGTRVFGALGLRTAVWHEFLRWRGWSHQPCGFPAWGWLWDMKPFWMTEKNLCDSAVAIACYSWKGMKLLAWIHFHTVSTYSFWQPLSGQIFQLIIKGSLEVLTSDYTESCR